MAADNDNAILRCGICPQLGRPVCIRCEAADEIERLRAEIEVTKAALDDAWTERDFALGDASRLQALIDAFAEAAHETDRAGRDWHLKDPQTRIEQWDVARDRRIAAQDALLAAATKGDPDGR